MKTGNQRTIEATLEVTRPQITEFGYFFYAKSQAALIRASSRTGRAKQDIDPLEFHNAINGSGRPGSEGYIMIEGIGLSGATAITFEGIGVTGEVEYPGLVDPNQLNPPVLVYVRIAPWAEPGPRRFTLTTLHGEVSSGDLVFTVRKPTILAMWDDEGAPGTAGEVTIFGVGLDQTREIRFEGEGIRVQNVWVWRAPFNPTITAQLEIAPGAPLGPRRFSVVTDHGVIESRDVTFSVVNPYIRGIWDAEGAPGKSGQISIGGVGLCGATAVNFSGSGVTVEDVYAQPCSYANGSISAKVTIAPDAPLGPRAFTVTIPRGPGTVSSAETNVTFTVTPPRVDSLTTAEAAPGARGYLYIAGIGIGDATAVEFEDGEGITALVRSGGGGVSSLLNGSVDAELSISPVATPGPRRFRLRTPNGMVHSGDVTFTVSPPRVTSIDTTNGYWQGIADPPTAVVPGTSGLIRIYGIGLADVVGVRISGEGVTARLDPMPRQGPTLNPFILVRVNVSPDAPLGPRTLELELASGKKR
ncbi:MAG: hypothetical protein RMM98_00200 [Acidobacteriota bacterium]|nr:hypothetical protein [Blastocatellia bacterium]MDW8238008.1 hypothetical protein [Acidobacteriota bacterium]